MTSVSVVIPTRARPAYLAVALESIAAQASAAGAEIVVVDDDGPTAAVRALAERHGARYEPHPRRLGLNAARNTGVERSRGELVAFLDDDIRAHPGWLAALLEGAHANGEVDVFAGRVLPTLEGVSPRSCGADHPPVTALDLGEHDADARYAWGANMAIRRGALERVGAFDVSIEHGGDEQEWQERLRASDTAARVRYLAAAAVDHRRAGADARLRRLARGAYERGRAARRFDEIRGAAPSRARELRTLGGCVGHVLRRRCAAGLIQLAHSAGRVSEAGRREDAQRPAGISAAPARSALASSASNGSATGAPAPAEDFLSGTSGTVGGIGRVGRELADGAIDAWEIASGRRARLALSARRSPPRRRVLVLGVVREERRALARDMRAELLRSRHDVEIHTCPPGGRGKFQNLNLLLAAHPPEGRDWLLLSDDDVELPRGFLDRFLFLCERFSLTLAQPAHRLCSHAAWPVTRRRATAVVHETSFVEIGPVTAFSAAAFETLLPFPDVRMGWGLDVHWAALARERGWRCGIVDGVPIAHRAAPPASAYGHEEAVSEARELLAERPYLAAAEAQRILTTHRRW